MSIRVKRIAIAAAIAATGFIVYRLTHPVFNVKKWVRGMNDQERARIAHGMLEGSKNYDLAWRSALIVSMTNAGLLIGTTKEDAEPENYARLMAALEECASAPTNREI